MFLMPHHAATATTPDHHQTARIEDMMGEQQQQRHVENDIKWPNGLSFFNALTGRADDAKLLFNPDSLGNKQGDQNHNSDHAASNLQNNPNEFLSLDSHQDNQGGARKMDKFKRSFTLPARVAASSSSSTSMDHHQQQGVEYRNSEGGGMYSDVMETFLE